MTTDLVSRLRAAYDGNHNGVNDLTALCGEAFKAFTMPNPGGKMTQALADLGRAVLGSWKEKDQEIERLRKIEAAARLYHAGWSDPGSCLDGWLALCASLSVSPSPSNERERCAVTMLDAPERYDSTQASIWAVGYNKGYRDAIAAQSVATPGASVPGEDSVSTDAESSRPRELLGPNQPCECGGLIYDTPHKSECPRSLEERQPNSSGHDAGSNPAGDANVATWEGLIARSAHE
jgi:hypothetical protein